MIPDSDNSLGGVLLPVQGVWLDENQFSPVGQAIERSLSGGLHVYSTGFSGGRPITLAYALPLTWVYQATLDALIPLADTVGGQFPLIWNAVTRTVMFRHESPPALDFERVAAPGVAIDQGVYVGQIKLIEVA